MQIDVYTATGTKKGTADLPKDLFEAPVNEGLMHQAVVRLQSNRRTPAAHARNRGEVRGSGRKLFPQKGTGRARRGSVRSPLLQGGGKAFGPRKERNPHKAMPKKMRRAALRSSLTLQARRGAIVGLESYPEEIKTAKALQMLNKMPLEVGRPVLVVVPSRHAALQLSVRNIPNVETVVVDYLNPEHVLRAHAVVFLTDALTRLKEVHGQKDDKEAVAAKPSKKSTAKKGSTTKKSSAKKATKKTSKRSKKSNEATS